MAHINQLNYTKFPSVWTQEILKWMNNNGKKNINIIFFFLNIKISIVRLILRWIGKYKNKWNILNDYAEKKRMNIQKQRKEEICLYQRVHYSFYTVWTDCIIFSLVKRKKNLTSAIQTATDQLKCNTQYRKHKLWSLSSYILKDLPPGSNCINILKEVTF